MVDPVERGEKNTYYNTYLFRRYWDIGLLRSYKCSLLCQLMMFYVFRFVDKRAHHNALERKRRDHIKESFTGKINNEVLNFLKLRN